MKSTSVDTNDMHPPPYLRLRVAHHHHADQRSQELQTTFLLGGKGLADLLLPEPVVLEAERPNLLSTTTSHARPMRRPPDDGTEWEMGKK